MRRLKQYVTKTLVVSISTGVFVFLFCIFFLISVVRIDSLSMSPTLKPNELVFIRPYNFLACAIKRNDIVQVSFSATENDSIFQQGLFFKRVIGLPGDTIKISNAELYINNQLAEINSNLLHNYIIKFNQQKDTALFEEEKITDKYLIDDSCAYLVTLTNRRYLKIKNRSITIKENHEDSALYDETIFPNTSTIKWNKYFFGPMYIPKKNDTIHLDTFNIVLYKKLITVFEGNELEIKEGNLFINKQRINYYIPKLNYYFLIGDNFDNSIDSRQWGLIPEKSIKAKLIK